MTDYIDLRKAGEQGATGIIHAKDNQGEKSYWFTVGHASEAIRHIEREWHKESRYLNYLTARDKGLLLLTPGAQQYIGSDEAYLSLAIYRAPMRDMAGEWLGEDLLKVGQE